MITSLIAFAVRLALVAVATFFFVVLFEHGPSNFLENAQADLGKLTSPAATPASASPAKTSESGT